jgi:FAD/FMN-containing dehydrogenase
VLPADADEVAAVVRWCYEHDVANPAAASSITTP